MTFFIKQYLKQSIRKAKSGAKAAARKFACSRKLPVAEEPTSALSDSYPSWLTVHASKCDGTLAHCILEYVSTETAEILVEMHASDDSSCLSEKAITREVDKSGSRSEDSMTKSTGAVKEDWAIVLYTPPRGMSCSDRFQARMDYVFTGTFKAILSRSWEVVRHSFGVLPSEIPIRPYLLAIEDVQVDVCPDLERSAITCSDEYVSLFESEPSDEDISFMASSNWHSCVSSSFLFCIMPTLEPITPAEEAANRSACIADGICSYGDLLHASAHCMDEVPQKKTVPLNAFPQPYRVVYKIPKLNTWRPFGYKAFVYESNKRFNLTCAGNNPWFHPQYHPNLSYCPPIPMFVIRKPHAHNG